MKTFFWLLRREFWEHRAIVIAPVVTALVLFALGAVGGIQASEDPSRGPEKVANLAHLLVPIFGSVFFIVNGFVAAFYLMDSLYGERKDRSVLFWRSLPVSDTATIAAKLVTGLVLAPLAALLIAAVAVPLLTFLNKLHFAGHPYSAWPLMWNAYYLKDGMVLLAYLSVVSMFWFVPLAGWFLSVSAWAPRNPFLWGLVPPAALFVLGKVIPGVSWAGNLVADRIGGFLALSLTVGVPGAGPGVMEGDGHLVVPASLTSWMDPARLFASPRLWIGLVVGGLLIFAAVQGRRYRTEA